MKKSLFIFFATIGMLACTQEGTLQLSPSHEIRFGSKFVNNASRAAQNPSFIDGENDLTAFNLWGFMDKPTLKLWDAEDVTKVGDGWSQDNVQYWIPGHSYYFSALAPMDSANWQADTSGINTHGLGRVTFAITDGGEDLIYADTTLTTPLTYDELFANPMDTVKLEFDHLLTAVKFSFKNGMPNVPNDNLQLVVKNVTMEVPKSATIDLAVENWEENASWKFDNSTVVLNFGDMPPVGVGQMDEVEKVRLIFPTPATTTYIVNFDVEVYMDGVLAMTHKKSAKIENRTLERGKAYNFYATITHDNLNLKPIEFGTVSVSGWVTVPSTNINK